MDFEGMSVLSVRQFDQDGCLELFDWAKRMIPIARGEVRNQVLRQRRLLNLFFEPSTRTQMSFGAAWSNLGGSVESQRGTSFSSMAKGETLASTMRCMSAYGSVMVVRTSEQDMLEEAANAATIPVINAGDGPREHPTQALLDLFTIQQELGRIGGGQTIALVGDLLHSRTAHSLCELLVNWASDDMHLLLVSPPELKMPADFLAQLDGAGIAYEQTTDFERACAEAQVLYMIRLQLERFENKEEGAHFKRSYVLDLERLDKKCRKDVCIMHPLPHTEEISLELEELAIQEPDHPNLAFFRQSDYGVPLRMALFVKIFGRESKFP